MYVWIYMTCCTLAGLYTESRVYWSCYCSSILVWSVRVCVSVCEVMACLCESVCDVRGWCVSVTLCVCVHVGSVAGVYVCMCWPTGSVRVSLGQRVNE